MAMTADSSSSNHHSPRDALNSPRLGRKNSTPAWSQVVRGEHESVSSPTHQSRPHTPPSTTEQNASSDCAPSKPGPSACPPSDGPPSGDSADSSSNNTAATTPKKPAWNTKPPNGVVEAVPVMEATSWPLLSAARTPLKSSEPPSAKVASDGPASTSQGPSAPQSAQKHAGITNPASGANRTVAGRQRSTKRAGIPSTNNSGSGLVQSGYAQPPPAPPFPQFPVLPILPRPDTAIGEPQHRGHRGANWEPRPVGPFVPASPTGNDHRHSSRRGNYGPRGDGGYHNFGGRRDQDRGNFNNSRDTHVQHQRSSPRGSVRPPSSGVHTFIPPQPMGPFVNPIGYSHDILYFPPMPLEHFGGIPVIPHPPPPVVMVDPEYHLPSMLLNQIEYYFSDENLVRDGFLKSNMDNQGWVPVSLISSFPRVKVLTNNIQLILDSLRSSALVEVQDNKVRRRNEWMKWVPGERHSSGSSLPAPAGSSSDILATSFQKLTVESSCPNSAAVAANLSTDDATGRHGQSPLSNGEASADSCSH